MADKEHIGMTARTFSHPLISVVKVKVFGGEQGPASIIAPKMGKLKMNSKKVQGDI